MRLRSPVVAILAAWLCGGFVVPDGAAVTPAAAQDGCAEHVGKLFASDATPGDLFGWSVAIDGDYLIVGAIDAGIGADTFGAAYIFARQPDGKWIQEAKLTSPTPVTNDLFGGAVDITAQKVVVGHPRDDHDCGQVNCDFGSVHIFQRQPDGSWPLVQSLVASDVDFKRGLGAEVAIDEDWIMATSSAGPPGTKGQVYAFEFRGKQWVERQIIKPADPDVTGFGGRIALHGDLFVASGSFSRFVFRQVEGVWVEEPILPPPGLNVFNFGGFGVTGQTILFGDSGAIDPDDGSPGGVHVYGFINGVWQAVQTAYASDNASGDLFGYTLAVSGNVAVAGAPGALRGLGRAHVFVRANGTWTESATFDAADIETDNGFVSIVALDGSTLLTGVPDDGDMGPNAGAAHVFALSECVVPSCPADCNGDGVVNIFDFLCFQGLVTTGDPKADCNGDGEINIFDFLCFQGLVSEGCG